MSVIIDVKVPDIGDFENVEVIEVVPHQNLICGGIGGRRPVATHLASAAR